MKKIDFTKLPIGSKKRFSIKLAFAKLVLVPFSLIGILILSPSSIVAQETWSIERCIEFALVNNIDLQISSNNLKKQEVNVFESKASLLPTLNIGSGAYLSFGRNIDGNTNEITFDQTLSNNYYVSTSIDLFQGFVKLNTVGFNKYLLSASKEEASYNRNKLVFDILSSYCTVLYSKGLMEVAESQLSLSDMQYNRMQKLVDIGRESQITAQELKSQWASDQLNLTIAENNYNRTILELKQLLRLEAGQAITVDDLGIGLFVESPMQNIDSLFTIAVNVLPEIRQQEYLFSASQKDLAIAKGYILPRLYASAGFNTNYFDGDPLGFNNQLANNQSQSINMGITIPIFNKASVYSNIKRKQIIIKDREYLLQKQKDELYANIWKALDELISAENEYNSANELYGFSELSLKSAAAKLEKGLANPSEYEVAKQRFVDAKASLLKAKIIYYMRKQMLKFYESGNWSHING